MIELIPPYFPGNKAICIADTTDSRNCWTDKYGNEVVGPKLHEEVTIEEIKFDAVDNTWELFLAEYKPNNEGYRVKWFKPVQQDKFPAITLKKQVKEVLIKETVLISKN